MNSLAGKSWQITKLKDFEDDEKRKVISMASDEELLAVGLSGWSGQARVYNVNTGELKFTLNCNQLDDTPAPFSHDNVIVWLSSWNIITMGTNDNTLTIWDRNGNMVARNLHKDQEAHKELERINNLDRSEQEAYFTEKTAGMNQAEAMQWAMKIKFGIVESDRKIISLSLDESGKIFAGTENGFLIIAMDDNGNWGIEDEVKLNFPVAEIATKDSRVMIGYRDKSQMVLRFWDKKTRGFMEDFLA